jgi:hypothetical protein
MTFTDSTRHHELRRTRVVAALTAAILLFPLWMLLDREPPFEVVDGKIEPENPKPGSLISITWDVKPQRACPLSDRQVVRRTIIDKDGGHHDYEPVPAHHQGHQEDIVRHFRLLSSLPPGAAKYRAVACYACNPLQQFWPVCINFPDIPFEVAPL